MTCIISLKSLTAIKDRLFFSGCQSSFRLSMWLSFMRLSRVITIMTSSHSTFVFSLFVFKTPGIYATRSKKIIIQKFVRCMQAECRVTGLFLTYVLLQFTVAESNFVNISVKCHNFIIIVERACDLWMCSRCVMAHTRLSMSRQLLIKADLCFAHINFKSTKTRNMCCATANRHVTDHSVMEHTSSSGFTML